MSETTPAVRQTDAQGRGIAMRTARPYHNPYQAELDAEPSEPENPSATQEPNPKTATSEPGPELSPEDRTYKARYDSLKAHYDKTVVEDRKRISDLEMQVSKSARRMEIPTNAEDFKAWKGQYPDLYKMIVSSVREELDVTTKDMEKKVDHLENLARNARRQAAEATLTRLHPDFEELRMKEEFHAWVKEQPSQIQSWLYENEDDPLLAAKAIDLYKMEKGLFGKKKEKPVDLKAAAKAVTTTSKSADLDVPQGKIWKLSEIKSLNRRAFEKYEAEIDLAREQGRIDFDA